MDNSIESLKYPIGAYQWPGEANREQISQWIDEIESLPEKLRSCVSGLTEEQMDTPYRSEGWSVRQVVHHIADSQMHAFIRFKLAIAEEEPTIKPFQEDDWATAADYKLPADVSLRLLDALTARWVSQLRSLTEEQFARAYIHPAAGKVRLDYATGMYAWHGSHHLAHIENLKSRMGWS